MDSDDDDKEFQNADEEELEDIEKTRRSITKIKGSVLSQNLKGSLNQYTNILDGLKNNEE